MDNSKEIAQLDQELCELRDLYKKLENAELMEKHLKCFSFVILNHTQKLVSLKIKCLENPNNRKYYEQYMNLLNKDEKEIRNEYLELLNKQ